MNILRCFFLILLFFTTTGCAPLFHLGVKDEQVNTDYYSDSEEFVQQQTLPDGIDESELLKHFEKKPGQQRTQANTAEGVQEILLGKITPTGRKEDIAGISRWMLDHHTHALKFKNVKTEFAFKSPIAYTIFEKGQETDVIFITEKDSDSPSEKYILRRTIINDKNINEQTTEYIWELLANMLKGSIKLLF